MVESTPRPGGPAAFVLSGGGSIGAVQVGMIHALFERGIAPELIVAASVGASHAVELGASRIYVLPTGHPCALDSVPRSAVGLITQALSVLIQQRLVHDIKRVPDDLDLVVLPPLCPLRTSPADFSHAGEMIERSREQSQAFLDHLGRGEARAVPELMRHTVHAHARG